MGESVEFVLRLKDIMSGALQKTAGTAQSVFSSIGNSILGSNKKVQTLKMSVSEMSKKLDELRTQRDLKIGISDIKEANREIARLERNIKQVQSMGTPTPGGRAFGGRGRGLLSMGIPGFGSLGGMVAGLGLATALTGSIGYAANAGMQGGAQKMSFETLAGDQAGGKLYQDLTQYAQKSIFGNEVYKNAQTQLAFGAKANDVMPDSRMLGDISMGNKPRLESLTLAYSQSRAAGRLQGQDLLQFVNAGFNPLQVISEKTGKSMAELRVEMEKGHISFNMVKGAFQAATSEGGKFYKMTERIASTPFGKLEAVKGQAQGVALQAGTILAPAIGALLTNVVEPSLNRISQNIEPFTNELLMTLKEFMPYAERSAGLIGNVLRPVLSTLGSTEFKGLAKSVLDLSFSIGTSLLPAIEVLATAAKYAAAVLAPGVDLLSLGAKSVHTDLDLAGPADALMEILNRKKDAKGIFGNFFAQLNHPMVIPMPKEKPITLSEQQKKNLQNNGIGGDNVADVFSGLKGAADVITGGGRRQIIINVNKEMIGQFTINAQGTVREGTSEMKRIVRDELLSILDSANAIPG